MSDEIRDIRLHKPRPSILEKKDKRNNEIRADEKGSDEAKKRSGGRCEVYEVENLGTIHEQSYRCHRRASQVHHMIGGWKLRGRGDSAKAEHKQHVCDDHHPEITHHVIRLVQKGDRPVWTDAYEREFE